MPASQAGEAGPIPVICFIFLPNFLNGRPVILIIYKGGIFMFCRNCGSEMDNLASVCVKCGVAVNVGNKYCANCGSPVMPGAAACTTCGSFLNVHAGAASQQKSKIAAGLFGIFLGGLGIHNFYLGNKDRGLIQILVFTIAGIFTCGIASTAMSIWGLIEGIMILTGSINTDANGVPLKD